MYFSDTATSLTRVEARPILGRQIAHNTAISNSLREGVVVRSAPMENLEASLFVYVHTLKETFKVEAPIMPNASAQTATGSYSPYLVGDKVLLAFIHGDTNRIMVVARLHDQSFISDFMMQDGHPIPQLGDKTEDDKYVRPVPPCMSVEAVQEGGYLTYTSYPMVLLD